MLLWTVLPGCPSPKGPPALRLGYFPNLTHAQALIGVSEGLFAQALGKTPLQAVSFNAGPAAMEALIAGSLDVCYVGSGPAVTAYTRAPDRIRVIAGAASGGAVLVVHAGTTKPSDLLGKRVATPQLGNTQDVALRFWLKSLGLPMADTTGKPNQVLVTPLSNPDILGLFKRHQLEGAWVPEPWGARLMAEAGGHILVDERTLWPEGVFPTTVLVVRAEALKTRRADILALLRAHVALTQVASTDPKGFASRANLAYGKFTRKPLPQEVLDSAMGRIAFTVSPMSTQLAVIAAHAAELKYVPTSDVRGMVDDSLLKEAEGP